MIMTPSTMLHCRFIALFFCLSLSLCSLSEAALSPEAIVASPDGSMIAVAARTGHEVIVLDSETDSIIARIKTSGEPSGLIFSPDGEELAVSLDSPEGTVRFYNTKTWEATRRGGGIAHSAYSPVFDPSNERLYFCDRFGDAVVALNWGSDGYEKRVPAGREPIACALSNDGSLLFVACHLPEGSAIDGQVAAAVQVVEPQDLHVVKEIELPNGSTCVKSIGASPDGEYMFVTHILAHYQVPTTQLDRGWVVNNALTIINVSSMSILDTLLLDDIDSGAANPWGVAVSDDGSRLLVTHSGTHELSVIDLPVLMERVRSHPDHQMPSFLGGSVESSYDSTLPIVTDMSFAQGVRERIQVSGKGPRGLCVSGSKAWVANYFSDSVSVFDLSGERVKETQVIGLNGDDPAGVIRQGEAVFHDASICFQGWQSCATCHPDGRVDGLNWDLLNDGLGNPKNTKSLLLAHQTPPSMSLGIRSDAETAVRAGFRHILFSTVDEEIAGSVDAYLKSLKPSSFVSTFARESVERGRALFHSEITQCSSCHSGPLYTDLKAYDVGTKGPYDREDSFDNPTLIELWRTAPYLHDGRAATIHEVLTTFNPDDEHGVTSRLSEQDLADLEAYLLALPLDRE